MKSTRKQIAMSDILETGCPHFKTKLIQFFTCLFYVEQDCFFTMYRQLKDKGCKMRALQHSGYFYNKSNNDKNKRNSSWPII